MVDAQDANSIQIIIRKAIDILKKSEVESPNINAEVLLSHILSCDRTKLHTNPGEIIKDVDIAKYKRLVNERARHIPLQYITGHVEFMSLDFVVDERVLIPRHETEILVETISTKTQNKTFPNKIITIMDIGTGCGNIAVSLAVYLKNVQIYASDISEEALVVARINSRRHEVVNRVHLLHGNLFEAFNGRLDTGKIDFIVSNPPYVRESEWNTLEPEVREHEPREALVGGVDGLYFYKRIIKDAPKWLRPKGFLILEVGETQAETIIRFVEMEGRFENIEVIKDLQKKERILSLRRK